ncbi:MAG TPA: 2-oxo acid dehydrogenase subunit E2, partial [Polyangiaceae bacterium]|nr:2-oxo acid dehydrogenase subunit E2 [Polyangiaceae bacterium]
MRDAGIEAAFTHLLVHATALALVRNPDLHQSVYGYDRHLPGGVDIGFSTPGATMGAPVVLVGVEQKSLTQLVPAMDEAMTLATQHEEAIRAKAARWSWLAPFAFVRRLWLRFAQKTTWFRRQVAGTFHISYAPAADLLVPLRLHTGCALGAGRIRDVAVVTQGQLEIRPMVSLTLVVDHVALDGVRAAKLLNEIAAILENPQDHESLAAPRLLS